MGFLHCLNNLLNTSCAVRISTKIHWVALNFLDDFSQLFLLACFSYLLSEVVSKRVIHEFHIEFDGVLKYLVIDITHILLYLLLQESASSLISREDV